MCQSCRNTLRMTNSLVPPAPYNLTIARAEKRSHDSTGTLITPNKETTVHYHCQIQCVKAVEPAFIPATLHIPTYIYRRLIPIHWEYLNGTFGINV